jgi:hypothetical protein
MHLRLLLLCRQRVVNTREDKADFGTVMSLNCFVLLLQHLQLLAQEKQEKQGR